MVPGRLPLIRTPEGRLDLFRINLADRLLPGWRREPQLREAWIDDLSRAAGLQRSDFVSRGAGAGLPADPGGHSAAAKSWTFISAILPITVVMRWGILTAVAYIFAPLSLAAINTDDLSLRYANSTWWDAAGTLRGPAARALQCRGNRPRENFVDSSRQGAAHVGD